MTSQTDEEAGPGVTREERGRGDHVNQQTCKQRRVELGRNDAYTNREEIVGLF